MRDLAAFTRQLGAMLEAGVNPLRALRISSQHTGNERLIAVAEDVSRRLEDGREFHQAIARHPEVFDSFYVQMARQGESDGVLGAALRAVADYLDHAAAAESPEVEEAVARVAAPVSVIAPLLTLLGVLALGTGVVWSATILYPSRLPPEWLGPIIVFWSAACLLLGAAALQRLRMPAQTLQELAASFSPALPPKTPERRAAEADAVVREAIDEQAEASEPAPVFEPWKPEAPSANGQSDAKTQPYVPEQPPRRFEL
jgi:hypothetical protein